MDIMASTTKRFYLQKCAYEEPMQRYNWRQALMIIAVVFLTLACSMTKDRVIEKVDPDLLDDSERALLNSGEPNTPLPVVRNTSDGNVAFLRQKALPVKATDSAMPVLLTRMLATMTVEDGVGIAAPQVGISRRAIWVQRLDKTPEVPVEACLNPEIVWSSEDTETGWEGCLSVVEGFGMVTRPLSITVRCQDVDGALREESISGFTARIFLHEIDHLDGVLFFDRMEPPVKLMPKDEYRAMRKREKEAKERETLPQSGS
jgi:peptide deformylase